ncbi:RnfABCDGE type electron transport complex subunit C [Haloplasma contractile]|uniref:Ion-translocating oxidoreductase complex subunit C n=1 Tax=Haloplasma contractile SSD-17B TaxID=1033810 RepID=U2FM93_9MOLU|nr:RnfABCDGE type electron transport complex subunit C [Haloplasma contractile]ERJ13840.1 Electron transport complex protein RnfC [Haloplasma contractile SSD-17B]
MRHFKPTKGLKISGHKSATIALESEKFVNPEYVYIPLSIKGNDYELLVEEGDKVKLGQKIARKTKGKTLPVVKHATVSGEVVGFAKEFHYSGLPYQCLKIKNDFLDTPSDDFSPIKNIDQMDADQLSEVMAEAGIVSERLTFVNNEQSKTIDTVILNGSECEPYITADYRTMLEMTESVIDGLTIMMKAAEANNGIIAIKKGKKDIYKALKQASKSYSNITIKLLPDQYPAGWEKQVVYRTLNRTYEDSPVECGVIVKNVTTAVNVSNAVRKGQPVLERIITVSGEGIVRPNNYLVRIGTKASDVIKLSGGVATDLGDLRFIAGGPMTGVALRKDDFVITRTVTGVTVLPNIHDFELDENQAPMDVILGLLHFTEHDPYHFERDEQPCVKCGSCVDHCPAGIVPSTLKEAAKAKDIDLMDKYDINACINCGTCTYVCPSHIQVSELIKKGQMFYNVKNKNKK